MLPAECFTQLRLMQGAPCRGEAAPPNTNNTASERKHEDLIPSPTQSGIYRHRISIRSHIVKESAVCVCVHGKDVCVRKCLSNSAEGCESVGFHMLFMHIFYYTHTVCTWLRQNDNRNALYKKKTQNKEKQIHVCEAGFKN